MKAIHKQLIISLKTHMNEKLTKDIKDWQLKADVLITESNETYSVSAQDFINLLNEAKTLLLRTTLSNI